MSLTAAKAFIREVANDGEFRQQLSDADSKRTRRVLAISRGYEFTQDEFEKVKAELHDDIDADVILETAAGCCPCMGCKEDAVWA